MLSLQRAARRAWSGRSAGAATLLLSVVPITGCNGGSDFEKIPQIKTYEHGRLYEYDFQVRQGFGSPRVGVDPNGTAILDVTLAWGKTQIGYGGHFIYEDDGSWVAATQGGPDDSNTNIKIWYATFSKDLTAEDTYPPVVATISDGERFDYRFRIRYRPENSNETKTKWSSNQSVAVAPMGGSVELAFDPQVVGETLLPVGQEIILEVRLSQPSGYPRAVTLSASPEGYIQIVDDETNQPVSKVDFEPQITFRDVKVIASGVPSQAGQPVTITGKSSGYEDATHEVTVTVQQ